MNKKDTYVIVGIIAGLILSAVLYWVTRPPSADMIVVQSTVVEFGTKLKNVSLLAPNAKDQIQSQYSSYITADLLNQWMQDPSKAPGKLTSSPWPDRIEVNSVNRSRDGSYTVKGNIVELTSNEVAHGGVADKIAVTMVVAKQDSGWRISSFAQDIRQASFEQDGTIIKDNLGLKANTWYLSYEQSGKPGLAKELSFGNVSMENLQKGMRVHVRGNEENNIVNVTSLQILSPFQYDLIWAASPLNNQLVSSPLTVTGQARGNWYFEASFPVKLLDANGKTLAQKPAQAQGEWMTTNYVPFKVSLAFVKPTTAIGMLVLEKDNPSGLSENAGELRIPVRFQAETTPVKLYYYDMKKDSDASGHIACSANGLVALERQIPVTQTPIQDTIKLLLQGQLSEQERVQGAATEFPLSGLALRSANLKNGTLTLEFYDPQRKTSGGSCRVGVLRAQIEATAKQFNGVNEVIFSPTTLFQP